MLKFKLSFQSLPWAVTKTYIKQKPKQQQTKNQLYYELRNTSANLYKLSIFLYLSPFIIMLHIFLGQRYCNQRTVKEATSVLQPHIAVLFQISAVTISLIEHNYQQQVSRNLPTNLTTYKPINISLSQSTPTTLIEYDVEIFAQSHRYRYRPTTSSISLSLTSILSLSLVGGLVCHKCSAVLAKSNSKSKVKLSEKNTLNEIVHVSFKVWSNDEVLSRRQSMYRCVVVSSYTLTVNCERVTSALLKINALP